MIYLISQEFFHAFEALKAENGHHESQKDPGDEMQTHFTRSKTVTESGRGRNETRISKLYNWFFLPTLYTVVLLRLRTLHGVRIIVGKRKQKYRRAL